MDAGSFIQRVRRQIRSEVESISDMLVADKCSSMEEYKKMVGIISGLLRSDQIIMDVASKATSEEDNL